MPSIGDPVPSNPAGPANHAARLPAPRADLVVGPAPMPAPMPGELLVRNRAVAVNPLDDVKQWTGNLMYRWLPYPSVLGEDVAGEVAAVGPGVERFAVGDRVLAYAVGMERGRRHEAEGGFQEYTVVRADLAAPIPPHVADEQAVVLPLAVSTAATALFQRDHLALPHPSADPVATGRTVVVWGGATSVGSNAIQLAVASGHRVVATASPQNHERLRELGADVVVDYRGTGAVADVVAAIGGAEVAGVLAVGTGSAEPCVAIAVATGARRVALASPSVSFGSLPRRAGPSLAFARTMSRLMGANIALQLTARRHGIRARYVWGATLMSTEVGPMLWRDHLPAALADGRHRCAPEPEIVGTGLDSVQAALDRLHAGVSARKPVVLLRPIAPTVPAAPTAPAAPAAGRSGAPLWTVPLPSTGLPAASARSWLLVAPSLVVLGWGGNQFLPLMQLYRQLEGYTQTQVTILLAAYVVGIVPGFALAGGWSDRFGRRPVLLAGLVLGVLGSIVLACSPASVLGLGVGRFISGLSVAAGMVVGTAWIKELSIATGASSAGARRASAMLTIGFGGGAGVGGALAQFGPWPTVLPYVVQSAACVAAVLVLLRAPETRAYDPSAGRLTGELRIPRPARRRFAAVVLPLAPWVFAAPALSFAVGPSLVAERLPGATVGFATLVTVITLGCGWVTQLLSGPLLALLRGRGALVGGALTALGALLLIPAAAGQELWAVLVAAPVFGCGYGLAMVSGLTATQALVGTRDLASATAVYYSVTYAGFALPVLLAALAVPAPMAALLAATALAILACVAIAARGLRDQKRAATS